MHSICLISACWSKISCHFLPPHFPNSVYLFSHAASSLVMLFIFCLVHIIPSYKIHLKNHLLENFFSVAPARSDLSLECPFYFICRIHLMDFWLIHCLIDICTPYLCHSSYKFSKIPPSTAKSKKLVLALSAFLAAGGLAQDLG